MSRFNLDFKILGEILVTDPVGVNHLFLMSRLNLDFKILGEILVIDPAGVNHLFSCPS